MTRTTAKPHHYHPTEAKFKGGAHEMYVTYDLEQKTRSGSHAIYSKVKRVYIAGALKEWKMGDFKKRSGRAVHGVLIEYEQKREGYRRTAYTAQRDATTYDVPSTSVASAQQRFRQVIEVPEKARNIHFFTDVNKLPEKYRHALQRVR